MTESRRTIFLRESLRLLRCALSEELKRPLDGDCHRTACMTETIRGAEASLRTSLWQDEQQRIL